MNYATILKDPHNRQVIKAIINLAVNNTVDYADLIVKSGKTPAFVLKIVRTFIILNQAQVYQGDKRISSINPELATHFVFNTGVITDLVAGLRELGFSHK